MDSFDELVRFETDFWNAIETGLLVDGLVGLGTLQALRALERRGGVGRVVELSQALSVTIGAASKLADRLERDGFAVRQPNPNDRRSSLIVLTDVGARARADGERKAKQLVASILPRGDDADALHGILERMQQRLDRVRATVRS